MIDGARVTVGVVVVVRVIDGVLVTVATGEVDGVRVIVAVGATPVRARYGAATQPVPLGICTCHQLMPLAVCGPPSTGPCDPDGNTVITVACVPGPSRRFTRAVVRTRSPIAIPEAGVVATVVTVGVAVSVATEVRTGVVERVGVDVTPPDVARK